MKIIELLQKIANGEEDLPRKIKYDYYEFEYGRRGYIDTDGDNLGVHIFHDLSNLNDEVEIIEEDKKIEKLPYYDYSKIMTSNDKFKTMELMIEKHEKRINDSWEKINEIIDYLMENKQ